MKKGLLGTTALVGASALMVGSAGAAEAPEWKLSGNMNFNLYWIDQDNDAIFFHESGSTSGTFIWGSIPPEDTETPTISALNIQDHGWYFGVDEAELALNVSGVADNGLKYGFKIEINANTTDGKVADEARIQLAGNWGTLQLGDEDGAEDIMNYGGENLMGGGGGFDGGDYQDVLLRITTPLLDFKLAPSAPDIAGDTSDATKISYFTPRFSGFQVGASLTPTPNNGDEFKEDGDWENHYGLGANYDNSFGDLRIRASAVYSANSSNDTSVEDVSAWSVGAIVGFGPFSVGGNYTDNGDSGEFVGSGMESSYWNAAAQYASGPFKIAGGYFEGTRELGSGLPDSTFTNISLTGDYQAAPGLGFYAEVDLIEDEIKGGVFGPGSTNDATVVIVGAKASF